MTQNTYYRLQLLVILSIIGFMLGAYGRYYTLGQRTQMNSSQIKDLQKYRLSAQTIVKQYTAQLYRFGQDLQKVHLTEEKFSQRQLMKMGYEKIAPGIYANMMIVKAIDAEIYRLILNLLKNDQIVLGLVSRSDSNATQGYLDFLELKPTDFSSTTELVCQLDKILYYQKYVISSQINGISAIMIKGSRDKLDQLSLDIASAQIKNGQWADLGANLIDIAINIIPDVNTLQKEAKSKSLKTLILGDDKHIQIQPYSHWLQISKTEFEDLDKKLGGFSEICE